MVPSRQDQKTAQIIDAAVDEILGKGREAASMHHIAETASVSKRTLYKYFPTKEELFDAIVQELLDSLDECVQLPYDASQPLEAQLERIISATIELLVSDSYQKISRIVIGELLRCQTPPKKQLERMNATETQFVKWLKAAKKDGKVVSEFRAEAIACQFHSMIKGQVFYPVLYGITKPTKKPLESATKMALELFVKAYCR